MSDHGTRALTFRSLGLNGRQIVVTRPLGFSLLSAIIEEAAESDPTCADKWATACRKLAVQLNALAARLEQ